MTDPDLLAKQLSLIETYVGQIRRLGRLQKITDDLREERFVEHTLQMAIQAALNSAAHIVSSERLGERLLTATCSGCYPVNTGSRINSVDPYEKWRVSETSSCTALPGGQSDYCSRHRREPSG